MKYIFVGAVALSLLDGGIAAAQDAKQPAESRGGGGAAERAPANPGAERAAPKAQNGAPERQAPAARQAEPKASGAQNRQVERKEAQPEPRVRKGETENRGNAARNAQQAPSAKEDRARQSQSNAPAKSPDGAQTPGSSAQTKQPPAANERNAAQPGAPGAQPNANPQQSSQQQNSQAGRGQVQTTQLNQQQRVQIRQVALQQRVQHLTRVNFNVSVGSRVNRRLRLYVIPAAILTLVPEYRRYRYIVVDERVCIVDPATYAIVDVIDDDTRGGPSRPVTAELTLSSGERAMLLDRISMNEARSDFRFRLALGAEVPSQVRLYDFPRDVVDDIPRLASYQYVVVENDLLIVEPNRRDITLVIHNN